MDDLDFKVSGKKGYVLVTVDDSKHLKVTFENTVHVEVVFNLLIDTEKDRDLGDLSNCSHTQNNEDVSRKMAERILALLGQGNDPGMTEVISDNIDVCARSSSVNAHANQVTKSTKISSKRHRKKQSGRQTWTNSSSNSKRVRAQGRLTVANSLSSSLEPEYGDEVGGSAVNQADDDSSMCDFSETQTVQTDEADKSAKTLGVGPEAKEQTQVGGNQEVLVPDESKSTKLIDNPYTKSTDLNDNEGQSTPGGESQDAKLDDHQETTVETVRPKLDHDQETQVESRCTELHNHKETQDEFKYKMQSREVSSMANYYCQDCDKSFRRKAAYVQHVRIHMMIEDSDEDKSEESDSDKKSDKSSKGSHYNPDSDSENYIQSAEDSDISVEEGWAYNCSSCGLGFPSLGSYNQHLTREHGKTQLFQCDVCDELFSLARLRDTHRRDAHGLVKEWICKLCGMNFDRFNSLVEHKRSTHINKEKKYKCTFCDKTFQKATHYEKHKRFAKHGIYCEICKQTFQTTGLLNQHLYEEHLEDRDEEGNLLLKKCPHCILLFLTDTALERHKLHHDVNNRKWTCDHCQRRFYSYIVLYNHISDYHIHCDSDNQCPLCGKCFSQSKRQRHLQMCQKEKLYVCKICQKNFRNRHALRRHMLSHTKEKPFQCEVCAKCFSQSINLNTHMRTHTKEKPFSCPFCDMKFGHKCSLQGHVERKHPGQSLQQRMEHGGNTG